ncbi:MAG: adenine phosphoribosyltransferase, partial [Lachnospiraceae bacterium]|nr:adenine phosphoribosyltransferase [Lachnospiraceae bacterium]
MDLKNTIRTIPGFPKEGIMFRDITTLIKDPDALSEANRQICEHLKDKEFDLVLGPESRGFIFGTPVAVTMHKGFVPVRKPGKLPCEVVSKEYDLEYGSNVLEMHKDAVKAGDKVIIVDDLLATGGTCKAMCELVEQVGAEVVSLCFAIELTDLKGRELLK